MSEIGYTPSRNLPPVLLQQWLPKEKLPEMNLARQDHHNIIALTPELNRHMLRYERLPM